jgi:hypothetical protein
VVAEQIPNLIFAHSEPGTSDPVAFGDRVIASAFRSLFRFQDKDKTWGVEFEIRVSNHGTPKLYSVHVTGSKAKHPKPLRTITQTATHSDPTWTSEELEEYERNSPEPESVERWQLKIVEQYRFQLLELGLHLALRLGEPTFMKSPSGEVRRHWDPVTPFTSKEIKQLQKEIDTKIRQKITPDLLAQVAELYTRAGLQGEKPIKAIQEFYKCSYRTAQDYATKARRAKLLPETDPGVITVTKIKPKAGKGKR